MSAALPVVEQKWKQSDAEALQERVNAIDYWLAHSENILDMFPRDDAIGRELRSVVGLMKTRKGDLTSEILALTMA
jgi:hypothetical protein